MIMVEIKGLTKKFENYIALDGFNLQVPKGSIYGLVGVNGSGKTTAIKHLAGVYKADTGAVEIGGERVYDNNEAKAKIGFVPDDMYFFPQYSLKALGRFYKNMYPVTWCDQRFNELARLLEVDPKKRVTKFSKGKQKQVALTLALSIKPEVLLLDEPIDGLDPIVRSQIFKWIIDDVASRQMTVIISSHNLKEMDGICDRVGIIKEGKMLVESDLDTLKAEMLAEFIDTGVPTLDEVFLHIYNAQENRYEVSSEGSVAGIISSGAAGVGAEPHLDGGVK